MCLVKNLHETFSQGPSQANVMMTNQTCTWGSVVAYFMSLFWSTRTLIG